MANPSPETALAWDPLPLARAVLADNASPPVALLAAWRCLYRGDCASLTDLAVRAAGQEGKPE